MSYRCLDLRDLVKELNDLRERAETCESCGESIYDAEDGFKRHGVLLGQNKDDAKADADHDAVSGLDVDKKERLAQLEKLAEDLSNDIEDAADNEPTLITKDGWVDYCRELADDIGYMAILKDNPLANHVDWDGWAEAVAQDYYEVEFDGETWLHRSY